ncbi:MAG: hypothetical protein R3C12_14520 [Planctomycetaceae bacterium]
MNTITGKSTFRSMNARPPPRWLKKYQGRGIIARIETEEIA